jgi:hypothetical protein
MNWLKPSKPARPLPISHREATESISAPSIGIATRRATWSNVSSIASSSSAVLRLATTSCPAVSVRVQIVLLNKPYGVLSQFTPEGKWRALDEFIPVKDVYVAGRLDADSEGLLILTDDGKLQAKIADPKHKLVKTYWAQVEGVPDEAALDRCAPASGSPISRRSRPRCAGSMSRRALAARPADPLPGGDPDFVAGNPHFGRQEPPGPADDGGHRLSYAPPDPGRHRGGDGGRPGARSMAADRRQLPGFARKIQ